jgi:broad specificity phosphatase PhoE
MTHVHLVRHAKAKKRAEWTEPDDLRPLTKRGRREAAALAERLRTEELTRLVSSPFTRCVQTLEPLAQALDLAIETTDLLAEGADGARALELLVSLSRTEPIACCTHGDVLYDVVRSIAATGVRLDGPLDAPVASTWVLEIDDDGVIGGTFVERSAS